MARRFPQLPPNPTNADIARWGDELVRILEVLDDDANSITSDGWTMTNVTTDRTLDADSTTLAEVADIIGTLIKDLQDKGRLG